MFSNPDLDVGIKTVTLSRADPGKNSQSHWDSTEEGGEGVKEGETHSHRRESKVKGKGQTVLIICKIKKHSYSHNHSYIKNHNQSITIATATAITITAATVITITTATEMAIATAGGALACVVVAANGYDCSWSLAFLILFCPVKCVHIQVKVTCL